MLCVCFVSVCADERKRKTEKVCVCVLSCCEEEAVLLVMVVREVLAALLYTAFHAVIRVSGCRH